MAEAVTISDVYTEILDIKRTMVSKEALDSLLETFEVLHNPETVRQIRASDEDIKTGRTKKLTSMKDLVAE